MGIKVRSGDTPLIKKKICGLDVLIKDESKNPFGTFKDRRSEEIIKKAKKNKINSLIIISSGNACHSLNRFSNLHNLRTTCIIDKKLKKSVKSVLKKHATKLIETDLSQKELSKKEIRNLLGKNSKNSYIDVSNGFHKSYHKLIKEIYQYNPDYIIVPVGSGEAFVGLSEGIKKYKLKTRLIGVGVRNKTKSFADKLHTKWTPYKKKIKNILEKGDKIYFLNESEIKNSYKGFRKLVNCEPSAAVVFGVFSRINFKQDDKIILINSGKGIL